MTSKELFAKADELASQLQALRKQACELHNAELQAVPLATRLVYAATARCPCGAGLAYDPAHENEPGYKPGSGSWDCSAIILGTAIPSGQPGAVTHTDRLPFAFSKVKCEGQPSANGATTRP